MKKIIIILLFSIPAFAMNKEAVKLELKSEVLLPNLDHLHLLSNPLTRQPILQLYDPAMETKKIEAKFDIETMLKCKLKEIDLKGIALTPGTDPEIITGGFCSNETYNDTMFLMRFPLTLFLKQALGGIRFANATIKGESIKEIKLKLLKDNALKTTVRTRTHDKQFYGKFNFLLSHHENDGNVKIKRIKTYALVKKYCNPSSQN